MKNLEADVVVVSAGTAGLPAAVTAAQGGARVIIFEKSNRTGGTGGGGQIIAIESGPQRRQGVTLTKRELFLIHMDWAHWRADARLVKAFYDESGPTIDWLEGMGLEFSVMDHPTGIYSITHRSEGTPMARADLLTGKAKETGVQILLKTMITTVLKFPPL